MTIETLDVQVCDNRNCGQRVLPDSDGVHRGFMGTAQEHAAWGGVSATWFACTGACIHNAIIHRLEEERS